MEKITKKQFLSGVRHEIDMLKLHADPIEKAKLDFNDFDPNSMRSCIYGQMTGDCNSERAKKLMCVACLRTVNNPGCGVARDFKELKSRINGELIPDDWSKKRYYFPEFLSVLESYILLDESKNKEVLSYIKGETETLVL